MALMIEIDQESAMNILNDLDALADSTWRSSERALETDRDLAEKYRVKFHAICDRRNALQNAINAAKGA